MLNILKSCRELLNSRKKLTAHSVLKKGCPSMSIKILGTGAYVPEKIVTNDDLSKMVDTSDEWIMQRVGVKERHVSVTETAADFAIHAAEQALASAGISGADIDLIVAATNEALRKMEEISQAKMAKITGGLGGLGGGFPF